MSSFKLPASVAIASLLLASFNASAQTSMSTPPAMQAPMTQAAPVGTAPMNHGSIDSQGSGAIPSLPLEVQNVNGITFINGGIGDEEVAELKAKEKEFNVHVLVSAPQGAFISDVGLSLQDSKGATLLNVKDAGPYFYAKLPVGTYTLILAAGGEQKKMTIKAPAKGAIKKQVEFKESGGIASPHAPTATID